MGYDVGMRPPTRPTIARRASWALVATYAVTTFGVALGCNSIFGVDGLSYQGGASGGGGSSSSGVGGEAGGCSYDLNGCRCLRDEGECVGLPDLSGWTTNVQRYTGPQSGGPACTAPFVVGATAKDAVTCPACECASPSVSCQVAATFYVDASCGGTNLAVELNDQGCAVIDDSAGWTAADLTFDATGSCVPVGRPSVPTAAFVAVCETPTSCGAGCLPIAEPGFDDRLCIARAGDMACPTGFTERHVVYDSEDFCTPCGCGPTMGTTCTLNLYFNDPVCAGSWTTKNGDQACDSVGSPPPLSGKTVVAQQGWCQPTGGTPLPIDQVVSHTVCCISTG